MKFAKVQKIDDKPLEKWSVPGAYVDTKAPLEEEDIAVILKAVQDMNKAAPKDGNGERR